MTLKFKDIRHLPELGRHWDRNDLKLVELVDLEIAQGRCFRKYVAGVTTDFDCDEIYLVCSDSADYHRRLEAPALCNIKWYHCYRIIELDDF